MRLVTAFAVLGACVLAGCEPVKVGGPGNIADQAAPQTKPSPAPASDVPAASTQPAASPAASVETKPAEPDNTAVNQRDANAATKTPIDQKETQRDVNVTASIRKRVVDTEHFSINARNVKIITEDGKVVLRGPVNSAEEKEKIDAIAREIAGKDNVENQIEVKEAKP